jgi:hypothetical protein
VRARSFIARTITLEVLPCIRQGERSVWSTANDGDILIVLAIIFPKTDRANIELTASGKRTMAATRTGVADAFLRPDDHRVLIETSAVLLEPPIACLEFLRSWIFVTQGRPNGRRVSGSRRAEGDERVRCTRVLGATLTF